MGLTAAMTIVSLEVGTQSLRVSVAQMTMFIFNKNHINDLEGPQGDGDSDDD